MIDDLLVCPGCGSDLPLVELRESGSQDCPSCDRRYGFDGAFDLRPDPLPDTEVAEIYDLWERLHENAVASYQDAPEANLSIGERADARAFFQLAQPMGHVLDVGCGPQALPAYAGAFEGRLVGLDPLRGEARRDFEFVQGLAEYLPFRDGAFDQMLFATSLDHMLAPGRALAEARRVLRAGGSVAVWFGVGDDSPAVTRSSVPAMLRDAIRRRELRKAIARVVRRRVSALAGRQPTPPATRTLEIPDGAVDAYHLVHLTPELVAEWLEGAGLRVVRTTSEIPDNWFVQAVPADPA